MANGFENLKGISGLLVFLNHPMREPKFEEGTILKQEYERLVEEAWVDSKLFKELKNGNKEKT